VRGNRHEEELMFDFIQKSMLAGIGLALKTKDEVESLAKDIEKKLNLSEKDGKKFLKDVQKKYDEAQSKLEKRVEQSVKEILKKMDIVTQDELKGLKKEIRELKTLISKKDDASQ
jgi:polyhydroxyalkanoate synthesis regulator phasin